MQREMPESLEAVIDAATPAAVEAATASSADKADTSKVAPSSSTGSTGSTAAAGSAAHPTPAGTDGAATIAPTTSDGKPSIVDPDELTAEEKTRGVPTDKHIRILGNARTKERAETEARIFSEIGFSREDIAAGRPHLEALDSDPVGYYNWLGEQLRAQGMLNGDAPKAPTRAASDAPTERPLPDLRTEDGLLVYSDKQQEKLLAWERSKIFEQLDQRFKPVEDLQKRLAEQEMRAVGKQHAAVTLEQLKHLEGWDTISKQISGALNGRDLRAKFMRGEVTVHELYLRFLPDYLKSRDEKLTAEARQKTLDEIKAKPTPPGKQVNPSAATVGARANRRDRGVDDILDRAAAQFIQ